MTTEEYGEDGPAVKDMTLFMQKAERKGFYEPGWMIEDYIRNAPEKYRWAISIEG